MARLAGWLDGWLVVCLYILCLRMSMLGIRNDELIRLETVVTSYIISMPGYVRRMLDVQAVKLI